MALTTYTELQAAVASWMHRTDLTTVIVDCIRLAEEKFDRRLRTRHQEFALSETAISGYQITIPTGTVAAKQLWLVNGTEKYELSPSTLETVIPRQASGDTASMYAWGATTWEFDGTGSVGGVLYASIPALSFSATNWLLTAHPSAYLYAALAEACVYTRDAEGQANFEARAEAKISEIMRTESRDAMSGPVRVRVKGAYTP